MKNVEYADALRNTPGLLKLAEESTTRLDGIIGKSASQVSAEWSKAKDASGKDLLTVRIWDPTAQAQLQFTPEEYKIPHLSKFLLLRLWGDLLEDRWDQRKKELDSDRDSGD